MVDEQPKFIVNILPMEEETEEGQVVVSLGTEFRDETIENVSIITNMNYEDTKAFIQFVSALLDRDPVDVI